MTNPSQNVYPYKIKRQDETEHHLGISIRQHFAVIALQGLLASSPQNVMHGLPQYSDYTGEICGIAVNMADELIKALNREQ